MYKRQRDNYAIAFFDGELTGFAHVRTFEKSTVLQGLGVLPQLRRHGIGKALTAYAVEFAEREFPGKPLKLKVKIGNDAAIAIYLKDGFVYSRTDGGAYKFVKAGMN